MTLCIERTFVYNQNIYVHTLFILPVHGFYFFYSYSDYILLIRNNTLLLSSDINKNLYISKRFMININVYTHFRKLFAFYKDLVFIIECYI